MPPSWLQLIARGQMRGSTVSNTRLRLNAGGLVARQLQGHRGQALSDRVSPDIASRVTQAILDETRGAKNGNSTRHIPRAFFDAGFMPASNAIQASSRPAERLDLEAEVKSLGQTPRSRV